jgi:hypothetical protein
MREDKFYAVYQGGNVHDSTKFDIVKNQTSLFYLKRIYDGASQTQFGNYHIDYSFYLMDENLQEIVPVIGGMKIIKLSAFDNTQGFVATEHNRPSLSCSLLDSKGNIYRVRFVISSDFIYNLKYLFKLIDEVDSVGGFVAYEMLSERSFEKSENYWCFKEWK